MGQKIVVAEGVVVSLDFTLTVDGEVVDSTRGQDDGPIEFIQGLGQIIPGLEKALQGMALGEKKHVVVHPDDAYGDVDPEAYETLSKDEFPASIPLELGMQLEMEDEEGDVLLATIVEVEGDHVQLDFNHPLAGKRLDFELEIAGLRMATDEEKDHGHVHDEGSH